MLNMIKHKCAVEGCERTANVITNDGFCAYTHCLPCTGRGIVARHIRKYRATVTPISETECGDVCSARIESRQ